MPRCSVIVVTHNSGLHIEACLRALANQDCEIVVVDNGSEDNTPELVRELGNSVALKFEAFRKNRGFAAGVNAGVASATGDVFLLLNPDAVAEPGAIQALLDCLDRTGASAIGGALVGDDGEVEKGFAFRRQPTAGSLLFEVLLINTMWRRNTVNRRYRCLDADYAAEQSVEQPAGACLAVKRDAWDAVGGMDERFFPVWFEDADLCSQLLQAGMKIVYCPAARFVHAGAHSVGGLAFADKQLYWYANMLRYARKHFRGWQVVALRLGIVFGMALRGMSSLLFGLPRGVPRGLALRAYSGVALMAAGLKSES